MVNKTPVQPADLSAEEKRRLLVHRLQQRAERSEFPLSFAQQRLWFLHRMDPESAAYHIPLALRARGEVRVDVLRRALRSLAERHDSLRTVFAERDGRAVQIVLPHAADVLDEVDLRSLPAGERTAELDRLAAATATRPFDLEHGPLLRAVAARLADDEWALLLAVHHIVSDGWSMGVLVRELSELYAAHAEGREPALPPIATQYPEWALWQRRALKGEALERETAFWKEQLEGAPALLELPTDRPRPAVAGHGGGSRPFALEAGPYAALAALALEEGATPFMAMMAAWQLLLARWSGQDDVVVGTPIAGRAREELHGLIGFFVNTLPIRARLSGDLTFRQLLRQVRETVLGAFAHPQVPFEKMVEELAVERTQAHAPLVQVAFAMQNMERGEMRIGSAELEPMPVGTDTARFDLQLTAGEADGGIAGTLLFRADLFDGDTAGRMLEQLTALLGAVAADPDRRVDEYPLVSAGERARLLAWSGSGAEGEESTVHALFSAQAARTPDAVAVVFGDQALTYAALDERANRLAHHLVARGVGPDVKVALCMERSLDMAVGLLGVLKAGGAYVPLDLGYPAERLAFMAADAQVRVVLTQHDLAADLPVMADHVVCLDADRGEIERHPATPPPVGTTPDHLAYVIYTSGSTGQPKGTEVPHRAIPGFFRGTGYVSWDAGQVHLQHASTSWDVLTLELWPALLTGARSVLFPARASEPALLGEQVRRHGVTILWLSSAYFNLIVDTCPEVLDGVRQVMTGGEPVSPAHVRRAQALHPGLHLVNGYGPSECTVFAACWPIPRPFEGAAVPVGNPVGDRRVFLVDRRMELVPTGVPGELCVGGPAVARGYLNRPALTAEKFAPDPFSATPGARLYRTGDRVRWSNGGVLEFVGRVDFQAKVRGFRVEPGEVEAALLADERVREAVVVVREDVAGDRRLVAYAVPAEGAAPRGSELRAALKERLPEYMVPSAFVVLDALPLSAHGKVDRRALPAPDAASSGEHVAPRTPAEEVVAGIFAEVLRVERAGATDDFFVLGGHSLLATRLVSRVRDAFGVELPLRALFDDPTVGGVAARVEALRGAEGALLPPIEPGAVEGDRPLSFAQERLWVMDRLQPGGSVYNVSAALRLAGELDVDAMRRAFAEVVRRHEVLRTSFPEVGGAPVQRVAAFDGFPLPVDDLSGLDAAKREAEVRRRVAADAALPFDLARGPLFRAALLRLGEREHALLAAMHHIVVDLWSLQVLFRELSLLYAAFAEGRPSPLAELPVQYADYAVWQRRHLRGEMLDRQAGWWRERLAGAPALLELPTDRPRPATQSHRGGLLHFTLAPELAGRLRELERSEGATPYMVLLAAYQLLLAKYARTDDVVVGSPIAGRTRREVEELVGFFVNTLAVRTDLSGDPSFRELLRRVRQTTLGAYEHQEVPFDRLVEELQPERNAGYNPVFQAFFAYQTPSGEALRLPGLEVAEIPAADAAAKFDVALFLMPRGEALGGTFVYATDLFDRDTAERMVAHLRGLLGAVAADPSRPVSRIPLAAEDEREMLLHEWSGAGESFPATTPLHRRFEARAAERPDAVAVSCDGGSLTYAQLNARANRLARRLRSLGVGPEHRVGLCAERSLDLVAGILAILKAGGAYVPLDPAYPADRLAYMAQDSEIGVLLAQPGLADRVPVSGIETVSLDDVPVDELPGDLGVEVDPEALAYVIYTSGSTGRPKGVGVTHANVLRLFASTGRQLGFGERDAWTLFHSYAFDFSVWEIWGALLYGGRLVVVPFATSRDPAAFRELLARERVTVLSQTPSAFRALARVDELSPEPLEALRCVVFGGEALQYESLRGWLDRYGPARPRLVNMYGITETTVHVTWHAVTGADLRQANAGSGVGVPLPDLRAYVADGAGNPCPAGVPGELWVGGAGVARGYLGRPGLTAQRFVPDPFGGVPGARLYRSGDLARWKADGTLEYLGRIDQQVKIRGFRIELGEIEALLLAQPSIAQAAVVVRGQGDEAALAAYVVPSFGATPDAAELRDALRRHLPDYMVPAAFVPVTHIPLTANGKLDRAALPEPGAAAGGDGAEGGYVAPRTPVEEVLAGIWAEVLKLDRVGVTDHFFEIGGHSLLATLVMARVHEVFGTGMELRALFEGPTVAQMAEAVEALRRAGLPALPPVTPVGREAPLPLSFAQERMWLVERLEGEALLYNYSAGVRLRGALDVPALERAVGEIVRRHEVLRTHFAEGEDELVQVVAPFAGFELPVDAVEAREAGARDDEVRRRAWELAMRPYDLSAGPLFRARLLRVDEGDHVLLLAMHHVVTDGWSTGILFGELSELYGAFREGREPRLAKLPVQYADYAVWQRRHLQGEALEVQLAYWKAQLAGAPALLELPTDRPRPAVQSYRGARERVELPADLVERLAALGRREGATPFMVLLGAFQVLLARWAGTADVVVGSPIAGRTRRETEGLIGFFVNTLVLRTDLSGDPSFREVLRRVRETTLGAYEHQELPFEKLVAELQPERSLSHAPLFQVMFALDDAGAAGGGAALPGLQASRVAAEVETARFDLMLALSTGGGTVDGVLEYATALFDRATIRRMLGHFARVLETVAGDPDRALSSVELLDAGERGRVVEEWNRTDAGVPADATLHGLFEARADRSPAAVAVRFEEDALTYAELDARANRLARHLASLGVGVETRVGILMERGMEMVVSLLAVLKAGGAYVPLDPGYPAERIAFMREDSGISVLLTHAPARAAVPSDAGATVVEVDAEWDRICAASAERPHVHVPPDALAYVIYTSGSTGRPKGVMNAHRGIVNRILWMQAEYGLGPSDVVLQKTPVSFDVSVWELFWPLARGATLVMARPDGHRDPAYLQEVIESRGVTTLHFVPPMLQAFVDAADPARCASLKRVVCSGEALPPSLVERFHARFPHTAALHNLYGPTEAAVDVSHWSCERAAPAARVPIGRPVWNTRLYVLDEAMRPAPVGVPGELYIGGAQVARGYLHRPALTAGRFVPDPFSSVPGARLYRTGDRARWIEEPGGGERTGAPSGVVEYLGRLDEQVKVRGFRVELGEIDAALRRHPGVAECVVVPREDSPGDRRLVAYVVADAGADELRAHLAGLLPEYMVPAAFVSIDAIPLTPNGKLDRRALPAPGYGAGGGYVAPRTPVEEALAAIWAEVLRIKRVGVDDSFFELGGHSLLATRVLSRVREVFGVELPLRALFEVRTVAALAAQVEAAAAGASDASPAAPVLAAAPRAEEVMAGVGEMSEEELDRLLSDLSNEEEQGS